MLSVIGILCSLVLLVILAYRNVSVIILAPLCALVAVVFDGQLPWLAAYTQIYMPKLGQFIVQFFPLFLTGAVFGTLMEETGSAARISRLIVGLVGRRRAVLALVLSCAVLTYGGVSLFVVVFAVFPLSRSLFLQADVPKRLIPAAIALGSFTFTMTALPGSVQTQNLIPMPYFQTTAFAAPLLGCLGAMMMFGLGLSWLNYRVRAAALAGEGYGGAEDEGVDLGAGADLPPAWRALLPVACVIVLNFVFSQLVLPAWDTAYLAEARFGSTDISRLRGIWSTLSAMLVSLVAAILLHWGRLRELNRVLAQGAMNSLLPIFNVASEFGYGSTIAAVSGFAIVRQFVTSLVPSQPLISEAIAINVLAGITGSASGGLSIALESLGPTFYQRGLEAGIDPQVLHRVASMSCGCLDSLPHNGAVITLLVICGLTHGQSYRDIAVVTVICPLLATAAVIVLGAWLV